MLRTALALIAAALAAGPAAGQSAPSVGKIVAENVVVRATASNDGPDTGTIQQGATVVVHHAEGPDWYAIQPPRGAVSWVNHKFIEILKPGDAAFPKNAVVVAGVKVKIAAGKQGVTRPLDIRFAEIPDGTILKVLGPRVKNADDDSWWYPIESPDDDFRYVPKAAVRIDGPKTDGFVDRSPVPPSAKKPDPLASVPGAAALPPAVPPAAPKTPPPASALWARAEQAEKAGDLDGAEKLYFQLARESNAAGGDANTDVANQCFARVHAIRDRQREAAAGTNTTAERPREAAREPRSEQPAAPKKAEAEAKWTGSGYLRLATFKVNGIQAYALEDSRYRTIAYAIPGPGVNLAKYAKKTVDLYGATQTHPDLPAVLVTVTQLDAGK